MQFTLHEAGGPRPIDIDIDELVIAGMTGRDLDAVQAHIDELAEIGVSPPSSIPIYYRVSAGLLTTAPRVQMLGTDSSGEAEAVLIGTAEGMLVAVGSDHTDRKVESDSIAVSKQMCAKPLSRDLWRYDDVAAVWDDIELVSDRTVAGRRLPYQRGRLGAIRTPADLIGGFFDGLTELPRGVAMFTGTIATIGEIAGADRFSIGLVNRHAGRALWHDYDVAVIPVVA